MLLNMIMMTVAALISAMLMVVCFMMSSKGNSPSKIIIGSIRWDPLTNHSLFISS